MTTTCRTVCDGCGKVAEQSHNIGWFRVYVAEKVASSFGGSRERERLNNVDTCSLVCAQVAVAKVVDGDLLREKSLREAYAKRLQEFEEAAAQKRRGRRP